MRHRDGDMDGGGYENTTPPWGPGGVGSSLRRVCIGGSILIMHLAPAFGYSGYPQ